MDSLLTPILNSVRLSLYPLLRLNRSPINVGLDGSRKIATIKSNLKNQSSQGVAAMARPRAKELTQRELEVMQAFWRRGESTVADVRDELAAAGRDLAYTTVATLVKILHEKGFLEQTNSERPFRFQPCRSHEDVSRSLLGELIETLFGGSREQLLMRLFEGQRLTATERSALESILREKRR
jgi:predicted transcriptional regulator